MPFPRADPNPIGMFLRAPPKQPFRCPLNEKKLYMNRWKYDLLHPMEAKIAVHILEKAEELDAGSCTYQLIDID